MTLTWRSILRRRRLVTKEQIEKFIEAINRNFGPPFLPENTVLAHMLDDDRFMLKIGRRDVDFNFDLEVLGAGTCIASGTVEIPDEA
jgi:hypothetical protein